MAINSVIADGPHAAPLASTPYTFPIAVGTKVSAAFAYFLGWRIGIPASVTLDGVSMTYVDQINDQAGLFALYNPGVLSGTTVNLAFTSTGSAKIDQRVYVIIVDADGEITYRDYDESGAVGLAFGPELTTAMDAYAVWGYESVSPSLYANNVLLGSDDGVTNWAGVGWSSVAQSGTYNVGGQSLGIGSFSGLAFTEDAISASATAMPLTVTVPTVGISGPGDVFAWASPAVLEVTVPPVSARADRPLTIPLVGQHTEMPARMPYPAGYTTPVVTHDGVRPVWTEGTNIVPPRTRMVPLTTTGTSGDPELVWDDDDQLIMTEYYE